MAPGKQQQQQGVVAAEPSVARRMWRVVRAVLYMLRRGLPSGRKLAMDLSLLLHRGSAGGGGPFSCRALDPSLAVHEPAPRGRREVEFSCSNTPSSASGGLGLGLLGAGKRRGRRHQHRGDDSSAGYLQDYYNNYDAAEVARMFEMLNDGDGSHRAFSDDNAEPEPAPLGASASATPSPARLLYSWAVARGSSPAAARRSRTPRRVTESPADGGAAQAVDRQADEFIRRFYEQLRAQRSAASTPDHYGYTANASPYSATTSRSPRPVVTAGIA